MRKYIILGNVNAHQITNVSVAFGTNYDFKSTEELSDTIKCYFPNYQQHIIDNDSINNIPLGIYKIGYISNYQDRTILSVFIYTKERHLKSPYLNDIHDTVNTEVIKFERLQKLNQL